MACVPKQGKKHLYNAEINFESKIKISEGGKIEQLRV